MDYVADYSVAAGSGGTLELLDRGGAEVGYQGPADRRGVSKDLAAAVLSTRARQAYGGVV